MSKTTKLVIIFSSVLLVCIVILGIMFGSMFNDGRLLYKTGGTQIDESAELSLDGIKSLNVNSPSCDIVFVESQTASVTLKGKIWAREIQEKYLYVAQGASTIDISFEIEKQWPFNFFNTDLEMTIYLPADNMLDVGIENSSGNLTIDDMNFGVLRVDNSSGNSMISNITASDVDYSLTSGDTVFDSCEFETLKVKGSSGSISMRNISGNTQVKCTSGEVTVADLTGSLDIVCSSGQVELADIIGNTSVECTSGDVNLDGVDGTIFAKATSGNIKIKAASAQLNDITARISSGNCTLSVYEESAFDLEANVTSGDIKLNLPIETLGSQNRNSISGSRNGGGALVDLSTSSGNITISSID